MNDEAIHALVGTEAALVAELARAVEAGLAAQIDERARQLQAEAEALETARALELEVLQGRLNALSVALHHQAEALAAAEARAAAAEAALLAVQAQTPSPVTAAPQGRLGDLHGLSAAALWEEPVLVAAGRTSPGMDAAYVVGDWAFSLTLAPGFSRLDPPLRLRQADAWAALQSGPATVGAVLIDRLDPDPSCLGASAGTSLYETEAEARVAAARLGGEVRTFRPPRARAAAAEFVASWDFARYCGLSTARWLRERLGLAVQADGDLTLYHDPTGAWTPALELAARELTKARLSARRQAHKVLGEVLILDDN